MYRHFFIVIILLWFCTGYSYTQTIIKPNYGLKSHETLQILKIVTDENSTLLYMRIENRIEGGNFCADQNIFLLYPNGSRSKLTSSNGIPVCPETYKFKSMGESLDFVLAFPPLKQGTLWIDLIEDCAANCFFFYGITLDNELDRKINVAFELAENGESAKALASLISLAEETDDKNLGSEGLIYVNIIRLAKESGDNSNAAEWYNRLRLSGAPRLLQYIKYLNDQGIIY